MAKAVCFYKRISLRSEEKLKNALLPVCLPFFFCLAFLNIRDYFSLKDRTDLPYSVCPFKSRGNRKSVFFV